VLNGYNGTIFAYGQTGCGKTHTMMGLPDDLNKGIIPKAFDHVFGCIDDIANSSKKFLVRASFIEIY
jgi:kinesin family protein 3/17